MNSFKDGSGDLFGDKSEDEREEATQKDTEGSSTQQNEAAQDIPTGTSSQTSDGEASGKDIEQSEASTVQAKTSASDTADYPYFVRRNNVTDERNKRLELHVRDEIEEKEAEFRSALAEQLETAEVSKTDAREFALLTAFRNPEQVAALMEEEGFGAID